VDGQSHGRRKSWVAIDIEARATVRISTSLGCEECASAQRRKGELQVKSGSSREGGRKGVMRLQRGVEYLEGCHVGSTKSKKR